MRADPIRENRRLHSGLALLAFTIQALPASGGRPIPYEYPDQFRQANMVMLQFQDALGKEQWEEALSHCSERVHTEAKRSPDLKEFFNTTLPFDRVVSNFRFGFWGSGTRDTATTPTTTAC